MNLYSNVFVRRKKIRLSGRLIGKRPRLSPGLRRTGGASGGLGRRRIRSLFSDFHGFYLFDLALTFYSKLKHDKKQPRAPLSSPTKNI